jgi:hypothetical protein
MFSLPSEKTAMVGAATISLETNPSKGALAWCTVTFWYTARCAHSFPATVQSAWVFQTRMIGSAFARSAAAMTKGPAR